MASRGNFPKKELCYNDCDFKSFANPWNFFGLFMSNDDAVIHQWLRDRGLILSQLSCPTCHMPCHLKKRTKKKDGLTWMCKTKKHEFGFRKFSMFEKCQYSLQDIMLFVKGILDGHTLMFVSKMTGM